MRSPFRTRLNSNEADTPITIGQDEPIKRTMSSVEALGLHEGSNWDDVDVIMATTGNKPESIIMSEVGQHNVYTDSIKPAKQDPDASPYTKVVCRFNDGEYAVHSPLRTFASCLPRA